jgi:hypothetical protein
MLLKIIVDGQVYYPALTDDARLEDARQVAQQGASGELAYFQFETHDKEVITLGCEALKRAVYIITK